MMVLYSGMTCPFSHSCRFVLFEKGCEFEIQDIDMFQPIDVSSLNPYGEVPILRERELTLYQAEVINMYIDDRFPHPQLMPPDPMHRARARLFLYILNREIFSQVRILENRTLSEEMHDNARHKLSDERHVPAWRRVLVARHHARSGALAPVPLRHRAAAQRCAADDLRRTPLLAPCLHRLDDAVRARDAPLIG